MSKVGCLVVYTVFLPSTSLVLARPNEYQLGSELALVEGVPFDSFLFKLPWYIPNDL